MTQFKTEKAVLRQMAAGKGGDRPLLSLGAEQVLRLAGRLEGDPHRQFDVLVHAWAELIDERKSRKAVRSVLEGQFGSFGVRPEPWLGAALKAALRVERKTRGQHHLYVVVSDGFGEDGKGLGLYVGRTKYRPETRFGQHAEGRADSRSARWFRKDRPGQKHRPLALLPSFFAHLNPLSKAEAELLEMRLVEVLVAAGVPMARVGGPRDRTADEMEPEAGTFGDTPAVTA